MLTGDFQLAVFRAARNDTIYRLLKHLQEQIRQFGGTTLTQPGRAKELVTFCKALLGAIERRDVDAAERLARENRRRTLELRVKMLHSTPRSARKWGNARVLPRRGRGRDTGGDRPPMPSVRLDKLRKTFGNVAAVRNISIEFPEGRITSVLGPSGCGKTTTLNLIAGFLDPDSGAISFGDQIVADPARGIAFPSNRRNLGMVLR